MDKAQGFPNRGHRIAVASRHHPDGTFEPNGEILPPYTPKTERGKQWQGWGTALKPAHEPIVVARKPLEGTVAENVLKHGTGAINVDACRVEGLAGRWPANFIHDGSGEVLELFPANRPGISGGGDGNGWMHRTKTGYVPTYYADSGSAARFFYCAKASRGERDAGLEEFDAKRDSDRNSDDLPGGDNPRNRTNTARRNHHPTVKPIALMRYLVRLVTPPGGLVLDPFTGSGTTGVAALREGMAFVGCEQSEDYIKIATARLRAG
jgi:site-specific DNA-methyltransferase (adenine-specific)